MTTIIGIDPGKAGAIAYLFENGEDVVDMPANPHDLWELLNEHRGDYVPVVAYIEKAQSMPGQGVSSTFQTGYGYGQLIMALAALAIPYHEVSPSVWKKAMGLTGTDKEAARALARSQWPTASLSRGKDHGRAEALLIARYGQLKEKP